jgi:hypothetical protein
MEKLSPKQQSPHEAGFRKALVSSNLISFEGSFEG